MFFAAPPASAQQLMNVAVSRVEPGQAVIVVKTDVPTDVTIDYGTAPGVYTASVSAAGSARHELPLTGLPGSARVYYRLTVADSAAPATSFSYPEDSFSSFKAPGQPYSFMAVGDNRPSFSSPVLPAAAWIANVQMMADARPDLALHSGDVITAENTDTAALNEEKYDAFFGATSVLTRSVPLYMAAGNHEQLYTAVGMAGYLREFTLPEHNGPDAATRGELYYSFDHGDTHFVILCSEIPGQTGLVTGDQLVWLQDDLAANTRPWLVVVVHKPLFGESGALSHANDPWTNPASAVGQQNRADVIALFRQYGVDIVFEGHDHYYKRHVDSGIQYIVTGGGGSPLYSLPFMGPGDVIQASAFHHVRVDETAGSLAVSAIDTGGKTLESFTLGTPALGLSNADAYWASMSDYGSRQLSVDYTMDNHGEGDAENVEIIYAQATNGVFPLTTLPAPVGDLRKGGSGPVTMKYLVQPGVSSFQTTTYAVCDGLDGARHFFPGPPPGT